MRTKDQALEGTIQIENGALSVIGESASVSCIPVDQLGFIVNELDYETALGNSRSAWNGSITGGATLVRATQDGTTLTAAASLVRLSPGVPYLPAHSRSTIDLSESYGKLTSPVIPQTIPPSPATTVKTSIFHADAEYDRYLSPRLYALADTAFDHNFSQGLQFQQIYGGGFGYTAILEPKQTLDLKGDFHYETQQFIAAEGNTHLIGASLGETYVQNLSHKIIFNETGVFIPAFNDPSAYSATVALGLAFPAYKRLSFSFTSSDAYLNNPPAGFKKNSFQFVTGVTYTLR